MSDEHGKIMILTLRDDRKKHHVSYDTILGMENAFEQAGAELYYGPKLSFFNKIMRKLKISYRISNFKTKKRHDLLRKGKRHYLFISMGLTDLEDYKADLKYIARNNELGIYCFDVWEKYYNEWDKLFHEIKPKYIFFAYKQAKLHFESEFCSIFVPQSMDRTFFYPRETKKGRLFMQMGRKNERIHKMILEYLSEHNIPLKDEHYIYEKEKGKIIFPDTNKLAEEICASKYFVAAPQSLENKSLTGNVSDVTARFYEAMACKDLIIGYKPDTFDELFPEDAMVELPMNGKGFDKIITWWENNPDRYNERVNRNYKYLLEHHTWQNRYSVIEKTFMSHVTSI